MDSALSLNGHIYTTLTPEQVRHTLTDDGWSSFDFGPLRVQLPVRDLTRVRAARQLAQAIAAQAGMWEADLIAVEEKLAAAEQAKVAEHSGATGPQPAVTSETPDPPFGGDDPALDKAVNKVATMPETRRRGPKSRPADKPQGTGDIAPVTSDTPQDAA